MVHVSPNLCLILLSLLDTTNQRSAQQDRKRNSIIQTLYFLLLHIAESFEWCKHGLSDGVCSMCLPIGFDD
jgi:hypothetical protein